jgi:hypothetical protein
MCVTLVLLALEERVVACIDAGRSCLVLGPYLGVEFVNCNYLPFGPPARPSVDLRTFLLLCVFVVYITAPSWLSYLVLCSTV